MNAPRPAQPAPRGRPYSCSRSRAHPGLTGARAGGQVAMKALKKFCRANAEVRFLQWRAGAQRNVEEALEMVRPALPAPSA
jgi:hypothetical protein